MKSWIDCLRKEHQLPIEAYKELLTCQDVDTIEYLHQQAREISFNHFKNRIYLRGLIEISNCCKNDCLYCGIRKSNINVERYRLSKEQILECCREGYALGFRTFVMQGGEDRVQSVKWIIDVVKEIRLNYPDCAITLSLGELSFQNYKDLFEAGANRYLLRHETFDSSHYQQLHPENMSAMHRQQCLRWLKEIGFQTGTGIMVGSPYQTIDHIIDDILFIYDLKPQMIGIGPFIPHQDTPFGGYEAGSVELTLRLISIFRLMFPSVLIPSTTALASLGNDGRLRGILAGANVVMPNLSPTTTRKKYELYNNKASLGAEAAEGLVLLNNQLKSIGYEISMERGDYSI